MCSSSARHSPSRRRARSSTAGLQAGLRPKLHADQLSDGGGATLAAELGALSADHLEHISDAGIARHGCGGCGRREPSARDHVPEPAADAGPPLHRCRGRRGGCHRLQPRLGTELSPAVRTDPGLHVAADDAGRGAQGRHHLRRAGGGTGIGGRLARGGEVRRLRRSSTCPTPTQWLYHLQANACVRTVIGGETVWHS